MEVWSGGEGWWVGVLIVRILNVKITHFLNPFFFRSLTLLRIMIQQLKIPIPSSVLLMTGQQDWIVSILLSEFSPLGSSWKGHP